jgi:hypothetical protein
MKLAQIPYKTSGLGKTSWQGRILSSEGISEQSIKYTENGVERLSNR